MHARGVAAGAIDDGAVSTVAQEPHEESLNYRSSLLLVDDDAVFCQVLSQALTRRGEVPAVHGCSCSENSRIELLRAS